MANERRRFQVGDEVRFKPGYNTWRNFDITEGESGIVSGVEPDPPVTGPTYRIEVQFPRALVPYVFEHEYELVRPAAVKLSGGMRGSASGHLGWSQGDDSAGLIARQEAERRRRMTAAIESSNPPSPPPAPPPISSFNTTHNLQGTAVVQPGQNTIRRRALSISLKDRPQDIRNAIGALLSEITAEIEQLQGNKPNNAEKLETYNDFVSALKKIASDLRQMVEELEKAIATNPQSLPEPFFSRKIRRNS